MPIKKNAAGKTAVEVAQKLDNQGSHAGVLRVLEEADTYYGNTRYCHALGGA